MFFKIKSAVRALLKHYGRHLVYIPPLEITGFDLEHDLRVLIDAPQPLVFDVGANVGQSIEFFQRTFPRGRIFAFEPDPDSFNELTRKYKDENLQLFQMALSNDEGDAQMYQYENSELNSLLRFDPNPENCFANIKTVGKLSVITRKIDSIIDDLGIAQLDLLKVDTQGWDYNVLMGAARAFANGRIKAVLVELNFDPMYQGQARAETIKSYLDENGFRLVDFYEKIYRYKRLSWCTALFTSAKPDGDAFHLPWQFKSNFGVNAQQRILTSALSCNPTFMLENSWIDGN